MFLETANAAAFVVSFIIPFSCKDRNFSKHKKMISKKIQSVGEFSIPGGSTGTANPSHVRSHSATDSERVPSGIPLGFSGKHLDVRIPSHNKKPSPFETRSYDNQLKPK